MLVMPSGELHIVLDRTVFPRLIFLQQRGKSIYRIRFFDGVHEVI